MCMYDKIEKITILIKNLVLSFDKITRLHNFDKFTSDLNTVLSLNVQY